MALFSYEALSREGKKVRGTIDASSVSNVREQLAKQGLYTVKITKAQEEARFGLLKRLFMGKVKVKEKILFTKQLAVLLKSGIPLLQAVELLVDQFSGPMGIILVSVKDDLKEGKSLADALVKYPSFEPLYIQLVRAGEASGKLEVVLDRLTEYMERQEEIRSKVSGALQYPIIQLVVAVVVVVILLTTVIPNMQELFEGFGNKLPSTTRFLLWLSGFFLSYYIYIGILLFLIVVGFRYWKRSARGAYLWDTFKLKVPLVKYITKTSAVVQFCYTLGILLQSGVGLAESLDIVVKIINNRVLADALMQARDKIIKQGKISEYLQQTNLFPPVAIYLLRTGEESGQLDTMLLLVAQNYETELGTLIDRATGFLGPAMLIVMAVVVGFIIMSVMGPILQLSQQQMI